MDTLADLTEWTLYAVAAGCILVVVGAAWFLWALSRSESPK